MSAVLADEPAAASPAAGSSARLPVWLIVPAAIGAALQQAGFVTK